MQMSDRIFNILLHTILVITGPAQLSETWRVTHASVLSMSSAVRKAKTDKGSWKTGLQACQKTKVTPTRGTICTESVSIHRQVKTHEKSGCIMSLVLDAEVNSTKDYADQ